VKRVRGGLVFKAHRLVYHSTLGLKVIKKRRKNLANRVFPRGAEREGVDGRKVVLDQRLHLKKRTFRVSDSLRILVYLVIYDSG